MAYLTIAVDDDVLRRAMLRALIEGTTVKALLQTYLERLVGDDAMVRRHVIVAVADRVATTVGHRSWSRCDLHLR